MSTGFHLFIYVLFYGWSVQEKKKREKVFCRLHWQISAVGWQFQQARWAEKQLKRIENVYRKQKKE